MPIEIKDIDGGLGVVIIGKGIVTDQEYVGELKKHLTQEKEKFQKYRYSISDFTAVSKVEVSTDAIKLIDNFCMQAAAVNPNVVVATVADKNLIYGLARMSQMFRDETDWENAVFRRRDDAEVWIRERVKKKFGIGNITMG